MIPQTWRVLLRRDKNKNKCINLQTRIPHGLMRHWFKRGCCMDIWMCTVVASANGRELKKLLRLTVNQPSTLPHLQVEEKMTHATSDAMQRDMVLAWTHLNSVGSKRTNASKLHESLHYWCVALTFSGALRLQLGMVNWHLSCQKFQSSVLTGSEITH